MKILKLSLENLKANKIKYIHIINFANENS